MRYSFYKGKGVILILLLLCANALSQDMGYAKTVIAKLASPEFKGRGYANKGYVRSARFVAGEFKKIGLHPFGRDYYQQFQVTANTYPGAMFLKFNGTVLRPAIDYLVESSSPGIKGRFVVKTYHRNDLNNDEKFREIINNARNSFIFIDGMEMSPSDEKTKKETEDRLTYLKYSRAISCPGVMISTGEKLNFEISASQNVRSVIFISADLKVSDVNSIELDIKSEFREFEDRNVMGYITGTLHPDSFVVILSHHDHIGQMGRKTFFPGANDNASGVAMMLYLAGYYAKNPPSCSMVFISPSAEELGFLGTRFFLENPLFSIDRIRFLVNLDLAGTGEEGIRVVNGSIYRDKFDLLVRINTTHHLLPGIDIRGEACISDHCLFYQKGVPSFYIYTLGGPKFYHDIYDRFETLPLTEFLNYYELLILFLNAIQG
jgi:aminopeptidase YwaD